MKPTKQSFSTILQLATSLLERSETPKMIILPQFQIAPECKQRAK